MKSFKSKTQYYLNLNSPLAVIKIVLMGKEPMPTEGRFIYGFSAEGSFLISLLAR